MMPRAKKKVFRLPRGGSLKAASLGTIRIGPKSIVRISSASAKGKKTSGGKKMPRLKRPAAKKKKRKQKPKPMFTLAGQMGTGIVGGSKYRISRKPDVFEIKRPSKKPKVKYV